MDSNKIVTIKVNPELDFFVGWIGGKEIPTKQDKFKPIINAEIILEEGKETTRLSEKYEVYLKSKENKNALKEFEEELRKEVQKSLKSDHPYSKDVPLEVYIAVSGSVKRMKTVDIDNMIKAVLDCLKGLVFEDDCQVQNVLGRKYVNAQVPLNSLLIGIRKIENGKTSSWFDNVKLLFIDE